MAKTYPFNLWKHGHDLEYRRNRAINEWFDNSNGDITLSASDLATLETLIEDLGNITLYYPDSRGIIWITGKEWKLANETVAWAQEMRAQANFNAQYNRRAIT